MHRVLLAALLYLSLIVKAAFLNGQETIPQYRLIKDNPDSMSENKGILPYGLTKNKLAVPFVVLVIDSTGNPVPDYPVCFTIISEPNPVSGAFTKGDMVYSSVDGRASTFLHLGDYPGEYVVSATIRSTSNHDSVIFKASARKKTWILLIISGLLGGLAFFLLGINMVSDGLQKSAGEGMKNILSRLTHNRFTSFLVGILITIMVQSSSATTVLLLSFVNSRLMQFSQTIGIILGASIGATITVQIIAFRLTDYALLIIGLSFLSYTIIKKPKYRGMSYSIMGFGILFFGMYVMSQAMEPLRSLKGFVTLLLAFENPFMGILAGTILTAIIQSSSAFLGILIILASQHLLSLTAAVPMILGANLGTCITAIIASIGSSRESKQVAIAHTLFKATGVLIMIWFIPQLVRMVEGISFYTSAEKSAVSFSSATLARQIANAHTIYNLIIASLFLPVTRTFSKIVTFLLPSKVERMDKFKIWYLDKSLIKTPSMALAVARQEILRMMQTTHRMTEDIIVPFIEKKKDKIEMILEREKEINFLRDEINAYLIEITRQDIDSNIVEDAFMMMYAVNEFEQIGDIVSSTLADKALWWCDSNYSFSEKGKEEIQSFHLKTLKLLYYSYGVFSEVNRTKAKMMKSKYQDYRNLYIEFEKQHYQRLKEEVENSIDSSKTHLEVITSCKNIGSHATNIARIILNKK